MFSSCARVFALALALLALGAAGERSYVLDDGHVYFEVAASTHRPPDGESNALYGSSAPDTDRVLPWPAELGGGVSAQLYDADSSSLDLGAHCTLHFDSLYVPHMAAHSIQGWIYQAVDYGERYGELVLDGTVYNLEQFVRHLHSKGVWAPALDAASRPLSERPDPQALCQDVVSLLRHEVIRPLVQRMGHEQRRSGLLTVSDHGITLSLLCRTPKQQRLATCTGNALVEITHGTPAGSHRPLRRYR